LVFFFLQVFFFSALGHIDSAPIILLHADARFSFTTHGIFCLWVTRAPRVFPVGLPSVVTPLFFFEWINRFLFTPCRSPQRSARLRALFFSPKCLRFSFQVFSTRPSQSTYFSFFLHHLQLARLPFPNFFLNINHLSPSRCGELPSLRGFSWSHLANPFAPFPERRPTTSLSHLDGHDGFTFGLSNSSEFTVTVFFLFIFPGFR